MSTHTIEITSVLNHNGNLVLHLQVSDMAGEPDSGEFDLSENMAYMLKEVADNFAHQWQQAPRLVKTFEDWQNGSGSFDSLVMTLIQHADSNNRRLLAAVYPVHSAIFENMYDDCRPAVH